MNPARLFEARLKPRVSHGGGGSPAMLPAGKLVFDKPWYKFDGAGAANIRPQAGALTHGTLNEMPLAGLVVLDHYEGVADGHYKRTTMMVTTNFSVSVEAVAYLGIGDLADGLQPPCVYLAHLLAGADLLPEAYVADLDLCMSGAYRGKMKQDFLSCAA